MQKILLSAGILLLLLYGCAPHQRPRFEEGLYLNPEYEFSLQTPSGWESVETLPGWLTHEMPTAKKNLIRVLFLHPNKRDLMIVTSERSTSGRILNFLDGGAAIQQVINMYYNQRQQALAGVPFVEKFSYSTKGGSGHGRRPGIIGVEEIFFKGAAGSAMQSVKTDCVYECHGSTTCFVSLMLLSGSDTYEENFKIYEDVLASLSSRPELSIW
ncbi:MAG: hypothetical protein KAJ60_07835 [Desulfobulbaceae bacterium]|nr:hypothetical protein [Desulfobulbaceae bacterium]